MLPYGALWKLDHMLHPPAPPLPPTRSLRRRRALLVFCFCTALVTLFLVPYHVTYLRRLRIQLDEARADNCSVAQRNEATQWLMQVMTQSTDYRNSNNNDDNDVIQEEDVFAEDMNTQAEKGGPAAATRHNLYLAWMTAMYAAPFSHYTNNNNNNIDDEDGEMNEAEVLRFDAERRAVAEAYAAHDMARYDERVKTAPWLQLVAPTMHRTDTDVAVSNAPAIHELLVSNNNNNTTSCLGSLWLPQTLNVSKLQARIAHTLQGWQTAGAQRSEIATRTLIATLLELAASFDTAAPQGRPVAGLARIFDSCLVDIAREGKDEVGQGHGLQQQPAERLKEDNVWCLCHWTTSINNNNNNTSSKVQEAGMLSTADVVRGCPMPANYTADLPCEPRQTCAGICLMHQRLRDRAAASPSPNSAANAWQTEDETRVRSALHAWVEAHKALYVT